MSAVPQFLPRACAASLARNVRRVHSSSATRSLPGATAPQKDAQKPLVATPTHTSSRQSSTSGVAKNRHALAQEMSYDEWLWPVDDTQKMFVEGHRAGTRMTLPYLTLNFAKPLDVEHVQQALMHLQRKTPVYHAVIRERGGQMWFLDRHPDHVPLDFKVLEKGTTRDEAIEEAFSSGFNPEETLWKSRLIPAADDAPCKIPELKEKYPYQYDFLTCAHHAVGDGTTIAVLQQPILDLLNAVIEGQPIDDAPLGTFMPNDQIMAHDELFRRRCAEDQELFDILKKELLEATKPPALDKAFPRPEVATPTTRHVVNEIHPRTYQAFNRVCKKGGVTFGTGLQAAINTAMAELVRDAGVREDYQDISVNLATDLRRYMQRCSPVPMGLHVRTIATLMRTPTENRNNFWQYAHGMQKLFTDQVKTGEAVQQDVVRRMVFPAVDPAAFYRGSPEITRDYGLTNMGDLTRMIPGEGKHVQITDLHQCTQVHKFIYSNLHQIFAFRGTARYTISYATDVLADETAQLLSQRVFDIMHHLSE